MAFTLFLLGALYVALVVALLGSGVNGVTVAIIAGGLAALNLFASDKLALRRDGRPRGHPGAGARSCTR